MWEDCFLPNMTAVQKFIILLYLLWIQIKAFKGRKGFQNADTNEYNIWQEHYMLVSWYIGRIQLE